MTKLTINIGTAANDGTGDTLRNAFDKTNQNFTELYIATEATANAILEETDPIFAASPAYDLTDLMISHINDAYNWGDHAAAGYAKEATTISIDNLKILVEASTDFEDFKARIALL